MAFLCGSSSSTVSKKPIERKIVILGDGACGKTSLLNVFTRGYFPEVYEPTVFENYIHDIFVDGQHITLSLWDTAGQEEFDRLRSLSYSDTHTIMLCFSVDSYDSLENVKNKWVGEIADNCEGVKLVLVALKCDLRDNDTEAITPNNIHNNNNNNSFKNKNNKLISYEEGYAMAKKIGALRYLECSAKSNKGVNEAFTEAARVALTVGRQNDHNNNNNNNNSNDDDSGSGCVIM